MIVGCWWGASTALGLFVGVGPLVGWVVRLVGVTKLVGELVWLCVQRPVWLIVGGACVAFRT